MKQKLQLNNFAEISCNCQVTVWYDLKKHLKTLFHCKYFNTNLSMFNNTSPESFMSRVDINAPTCINVFSRGGGIPWGLDSQNSHHPQEFDRWLWHRGGTLDASASLFVCLCWGLTSQSTILQSCRDGATASWLINQYFRGVKCLAQGHNTAAVGFEPPISRSGVRHSTTEPPRSPDASARKSQRNHV